jgi:hypothetical protein
VNAIPRIPTIKFASQTLHHLTKEAKKTLTKSKRKIEDKNRIVHYRVILLLLFMNINLCNLNCTFSYEFLVLRGRLGNIVTQNNALYFKWQFKRMEIKYLSDGLV